MPRETVEEKSEDVAISHLSPSKEENESIYDQISKWCKQFIPNRETEIVIRSLANEKAE